MKNKIVLGVTGSIAAYKAAEICSILTDAGFDISVIMTKNAEKIISAQTLFTLSKNPVVNDLWNINNWRPGHIALADSASLFVTAPATANFIGKYSNGIADDALTTFALSFEGKVLIAPAMNPKMWRHDAVQNNVAVLKQRGVNFIGPVRGKVACGKDIEPGRMADVSSIVESIENLILEKKVNKL
jgi:phosphopantothenoylcysteine synthetase/decarboxylase